MKNKSLSKLDCLKQEFLNGKIEKMKYRDQMYNIHKTLFDYSKFILDTDVKKIEIVDNSIIMTSREYGIKIICLEGDIGIAPIQSLALDYYEKNDTHMMYNLIEDDFTVFDIGANIGWFSIGIVKNKKNVNMFSFEPILKVYENFKANLKINNLENIKIFNHGFYNENKELKFYYYPNASGYSSNVPFPEKEGYEEVQCKLIVLDEFVNTNQISDINFIKCDVEGAELFVFKGAEKTIEQYKPIVLSEISRINQKKFSYHPNNLIQFFKEKGYLCFIANENGLEMIEEVDDKTEEVNAFFLHKEKHASQIEKYT